MSRPARPTWTVALILFPALFLGVSDTQLIPPILPLVAAGLAISNGKAALLVTGYAVAAGAFALIAGPLSDRIGRRRSLLAALAGFTLTATASGFASTFGTLFALRCLTGMCAGTLSTCALSYAADYYPYALRGRAMGILSMSYFGAFVVGLPAGTAIASRWGWNAVFVALAATAVIVLAVVATVLPEDAGSKSGNRWLPDVRQHMADPARRAGMAAAFLTSGGIVGFLSFVGLWLSETSNVSVGQLGGLFMASGVAATAAAPVSGWLSDRFGKKAVIQISNLVLAASFPVVAAMTWGIPLFAAVAVLGLMASARQAPLHALTTELVDEARRGEYVAVRNAASQAGIACVAAISSVAYDRIGFGAVAWIAATATVVIPWVCRRIPEPSDRQ